MSIRGKLCHNIISLLNTCTSKIMPNFYKPTSCAAWTNCSLYLAICSTSTSKQQERQYYHIFYGKSKSTTSCLLCHIQMSQVLSTKLLLLDNVLFHNFWQLRVRVTYLWKLSDDFCLILNELMNELFTEKRQTLQRYH